MKLFWGLVIGLVLIAPTIFANDPPTQPVLTYPTGGQSLGERTNVTWTSASDPNGDLVRYVLEYSLNGGADWSLVDDRIGFEDRFADGSTEQLLTFDGTPKTVLFKLKQSAPLALARLNITASNVTGIIYGPTQTWKATTAIQLVPGSTVDPIRVWINLSDKINQTPSVITQFVMGIGTTDAPAGRRTARICTSTNMTDSSCPELLQQTSVDCDVYNNCRNDPDFNYAFKFPVNITLAGQGRILLFEITPAHSFLRVGATAVHSGLNMALVRAGISTFYPDAPVRIEYAKQDTYNNTSPLTFDIGNDGSIEHTIRPEEGVHFTLELNRAVLQTVLDGCRANYRDKCIVSLAINTSSEIEIKLGAGAFFQNATSWQWITNYAPIGSNYKLRIKASDGMNESAPSTSAVFSVNYNPNECEQIPTSGCNITGDTTFLYGEHAVESVAILNNETTLDCNGATLMGSGLYGVSVGGQRNIVVENCIFENYHTAITTRRPFQGANTNDLYKQPSYNISILNNTFKDIIALPIGLEYINRSNFTSPITNRSICCTLNILSTVETSSIIRDNTIEMQESSPGIGIKITRYGRTLIENNEIFSPRRNVYVGGSNGFITLDNAPRSIVRFNKIRNSERGGISITGVMRINETAGNIIVYGNNVSNSDFGIHIEGFNTIVVNNTFEKNRAGLQLASRWLGRAISLNNYFYANRMIDNAFQAVDERNNTFDFLLMGNLWYDYMNDTQGCRDTQPPFGRCDNPYAIDADSRDRFPIRQGIQFAPDGTPEPVYEIPPIITRIDAPQVVIAGDPVYVAVQAQGIGKLEGLNIVVNDRSGTADYVSPEGYGISDPVLQYSISSAMFAQNRNNFTWQTNATSEGIHAFTIAVSDGETKKSRQITVQVLPQEAMLTIQGVPRIGSAITMNLLDPLRARRTYALAFSFGTTPGIPIGDGRFIPLNPDPLFVLALHYGHLINLVNNIGTLDSNGQGQVVWTIPSVPQLAGVTLYAAFITVDATAPAGIASISPSVPITLRS